MSVQITFEPDGGSGLVAAGSSIWEAARRLGVSLPTECNGRGECDSCAVTILRGAELLGPVTSAEERLLGQARLDNAVAGERLACLAILARPGEVSVKLAPAREGKAQQSGATLRGLPFKDKVSAVIELQAITLTEALNSMRGSYHSLVGKFLNLPPQTTKTEEETTKESTTNEAGNNQTAYGE